MWYLFFQIWVWLLLAFALGWLAHWFFCCRGKDHQGSDAAALAMAASTASQRSQTAKPIGFSNRPESVDDLKRIKGVGAVIEETLNTLGVYQFSQIADWNEVNVSWIEESLSFPGRIKRENWIDQAKTLDAGGTTDFAKRVDKGDVGYE